LDSIKHTPRLEEIGVVFWLSEEMQMHTHSVPKENVFCGWKVLANRAVFILILVSITFPVILVPSVLFTSALPIRIESDFQAYLRSDEKASVEYELVNAYFNDYERPTQERVANKTSQEDSRRRDLQDEPHAIWREFLEVIYYCGESSDCTSIFSEKKLAVIRDFELEFESEIYDKFCAKMPPFESCVEADSILNFFYPTQLETGVLLDGNGDQLVSIDSVVTLIETTADAESGFWFLPRSFVTNGRNITIARSRFEFHFSSKVQFENFAKSEMLPFLESNAALGIPGEENVRVIWYNSNVNRIEIERLIVRDIRFGAISLLFVLVCMIIHSKSVFLSVIACYAIALSFPFTYIFYTVVLGNEVMMIFNFTSVFVLVGIGADDFAIFVDLWSQSRTLAGFKDSDRIRWTWRRAAGSTFVTSATTAASFLANLASAIQPIREFGQFMGILVIFNYLLIILLLPPALLIFDRYLFTMRICPTTNAVRQASRSIFSKSSGSDGSCSLPDYSGDIESAKESTRDGEGQLMDVDDSMVALVLDGEVGLQPHDAWKSSASKDNFDSQEEHRNHQRQHGILVRVLYNYVAPFACRFRFALLVFFIVLGATFSSLIAKRAELSDQLPEFFAAGTNLGALSELRTEYFSEATSLPSSTGEVQQAPICMDAQGNARLCPTTPTMAPSVPTTEAPFPTPEPVSPTSQPSVNPTTSEPSLSPTQPSARPSLGPIVHPPSSIAKPSGTPELVLIADATEILEFQGDFGPNQGYLSSEIDGLSTTSIDMCETPLGSVFQTLGVSFVLGPQDNQACDLDVKVGNARFYFPDLAVYFSIDEVSQYRGTVSSDVFGLGVSQETAITLASAPFFTFGPPLLVAASITNSTRKARRRVQQSQSALEILEDNEVGKAQIFEVATSLSVVILDYDIQEANSLATALENGSNVIDVEVDREVPLLTRSPTVAPTTTVPSQSPTTENPTTATPTLSPTTSHPVCECSGNGECAPSATIDEPVCRCFFGWLGESCNEVDPAISELSDDQVARVDINWLRSRVGDMLVVQTLMVDMCQAIINQTNLQFENQLSVRKVTRCLMMDFANWYRLEVSPDGFPFTDRNELVDQLLFYTTNVNPGYASNIVFDNSLSEIELIQMSVLTNIAELAPASEVGVYYAIWEDFVTSRDEHAIQTSFLWARTQTELAIIDGTLTAAVISLSCAFLAIFIFTKFNLTLALATILSIALVLTCLLGVLIGVMGRPFGAIEALSIIVLAGMSVDASLHIAHSYDHAKQTTMLGRAQQTLGQTGPSVLFGAITTAGAAAILGFCEIALFNDFGMVIALNTSFSLVIAFFFLLPALLVSSSLWKTIKRKFLQKTRHRGEKDLENESKIRQMAGSTAEAESVPRLVRTFSASSAA